MYHSSRAGVFVLFTALRLSAQIAGGRALDVRPADAQYHRATNRVYALLTPSSPQYPQSVAEIDADELYVVRWAPIPEAAYALQLTDDGRYLYAVTPNAPAMVYRIDTATMAVDARYTPSFSDNTPLAATRIAALLPLLGQPQSFVVVFTGPGRDTIGVAVFDADRRRAKVLSGRPIN